MSNDYYSVVVRPFSIEEAECFVKLQNSLLPGRTGSKIGTEYSYRFSFCKIPFKLSDFAYDNHWWYESDRTYGLNIKYRINGLKGFLKLLNLKQSNHIEI
jgi:hypothetical protein